MKNNVVFIKIIKIYKDNKIYCDLSKIVKKKIFKVKEAFYERDNFKE